VSTARGAFIVEGKATPPIELNKGEKHDEGNKGSEKWGSKSGEAVRSAEDPFFDRGTGEKKGGERFSG